MAVTAGLDAAARVWDGATGAAILQRNGQEGNRLIVSSLVCLAVPPDGREISGGGWVGAAAWEFALVRRETLDETLRIARLLSCEDFDPNKGTIPLTQTRVDAEWKRLQSGPLMGGLVPPNIEMLRRTANYQMNHGKLLTGRNRAATELLRRSPSDLDALEIRIGARVSREDYRGALSDVERSGRRARGTH